jgi:hypothetical protein
MLTTPKVQISSSEDNSPSDNYEIPAFYEIWIFTMWLGDVSLAWRMRDRSLHKGTWWSLMLLSWSCVEASIFRAFEEFPVLNYPYDGCRKYLRNVGHYIYQFTGRHILQDLNHLEHLCGNLRKFTRKPTASYVNISPVLRLVQDIGRTREVEETADELNRIWRHADAIWTLGNKDKNPNAPRLYVVRTFLIFFKKPFCPV